MARLVIQSGLPTARVIELKQGNNSLGRGTGNDVRFDDPSVSGTHCEIVVDGSSTVIRDLGSTNGTYVNRQPIRETALVAGQTVHLGELEMRFEADAPAVSPPGPSLPALEQVGAPLGPIGGVSSTPQSLAANTQQTQRPQLAPSSLKLQSAPPPLRTAAAPPPIPAPRAPTTQSSAPLSPVEREAEAGAPGAPASQNCKHHPKTLGRFFCSHCNQCFCELCVTSRNVGGLARKFCRHCGAEVTALQVRIERPVEAGFFKRLPGAFVYPFLGSGVLVLIVGMILLAGLRFGYRAMATGASRLIAGGIIGQVFVGGYLFTFLQNIIHTTAAGDKEMPDLPGMSNVLDDIVLPFFRLLGVSLMSFAPLVGIAIWYIAHGDSPPAMALVAAALFGCVYFPMAFLAVAVLDSVAAANPLVVVPSMFKVPLEYLVTVISLAAVLGTRALGDIVINMIFGPSTMLTHSIPTLLAMFGVKIFWSFVSLYLLTVTMRILGLLYLTKKSELGWHSH